MHAQTAKVLGRLLKTSFEINLIQSKMTIPILLGIIELGILSTVFLSGGAIALAALALFRGYIIFRALQLAYSQSLFPIWHVLTPIITHSLVPFAMLNSYYRGRTQYPEISLSKYSQLLKVLDRYGRYDFSFVDYLDRHHLLPEINTLLTMGAHLDDFPQFSASQNNPDLNTLIDSQDSFLMRVQKKFTPSWNNAHQEKAKSDPHSYLNTSVIDRISSFFLNIRR